MQKGKRSNILSSTYQRNITKKGFLSFTIGTDLNSKRKNNDIGVYLQKNDTEIMKQFNIKGGIFSIDKSYYETRPINGGLALIKVNSLKNVGVYNNSG
ncbi:hypothetical protein JRD95_00696 [Rickettsia parkeri]|nr:hypothetical protein JRD95_00696 [Rickettsia parkeri]